MKLHKFSSLAGMFLLTLLTCTLAACSTSQSAEAGGNPNLTGQNLGSPIKAIRMLDQSKGWALTEQNILFTSDGGQSWKDVTPSGSAYGKDAIGDFMNENYAWIVSTTGQEVGNTVNVLRTSDGGQHWQTSTITASEVSVLDTPHFLTPQEGFLELGTDGGPGAGSEAAAIFHTTDGGQNWTKVADADSEQANGFPRGGMKSGISFKDAHTGWATGSDASGNPWLYMTQDGGHTWNKQSLPSLENSVEHYETTPPVFFGNNAFLPVKVGVTSDGGNTSTTNLVIYKSANGGASWSTDFSTNSATLAKFDTADLYIQSPKNAWATDQNGNVYGTTDGGEHWSQLASSIDKINALSFVDASSGWAISDTKLWHTTDGGHHWSQITPHLAA
jgi:photosystem II stability/assembly factor-like uncharacterized protein